MNKTLTCILVGGASALAGAVAGYFFCKKQMQDSFDEELSNAVNEELSRIRSRREEKKVENSSEYSEEESDASEPTDVDILAVKRLIYDEFGDENALDNCRVDILARTLSDCNKRHLSPEETEKELIDMMAQFEHPKDDDEEEETELAEVVDEEDLIDYEEPQRVMSEWDGKPPMVISLEDYRALPPYFEFLTFHYFEEDDVLIDDKDMIVDDVEAVVGDALVHFDEEPDDGDCVYVVNGSYGDAIEIVRMHAAYTDWNGWGNYHGR